jgi:hypothetical protein
MPDNLLAAQMWLVGQGFEAEPCTGELYFGWALPTVRSFMATLTPEGRAKWIEAGRVALFEGDAPIVAVVVERRKAA